jgi:hypothetical protein
VERDENGRNPLSETFYVGPDTFDRSLRIGRLNVFVLPRAETVSDYPDASPLSFEDNGLAIPREGPSDPAWRDPDAAHQSERILKGLDSVLRGVIVRHAQYCEAAIPERFSVAWTAAKLERGPFVANEAVIRKDGFEVAEYDVTALERRSELVKGVAKACGVVPGSEAETNRRRRVAEHEIAHGDDAQQASTHTPLSALTQPSGNLTATTRSPHAERER